MKDILIEFTEYGAVIHKDAAIIASLKDVPHCFFNPDLSKVSGVSPSFWALNEAGEIVKASPEEIQRRNDYLTSKPAANPSLKTTLDTLKQEIYSDMEQNIIDLKGNIYSVLNETLAENEKIASNLNKELNQISSDVLLIVKKEQEINNSKFDKLSKQLIMYKIAILILLGIALIGAIK